VITFIVALVAAALLVSAFTTRGTAGTAAAAGALTGAGSRRQRIRRGRCAPADPRALARLAAADTARVIQSRVTSFSEDELRDDLTIVVAKVKAPPDITQ